MVPQSRWTLVAALVGAAALAVGCGDDSETVSDSDFAAEVSAVCTSSQAEIDAANEDLTLSNDVEQFEQDYRAINEPLYDDYVNRLEAIDPPADKEDTYDQFVSSFRETFDLLLEDPAGIVKAAFAEKPIDATREIERLGKVTKETANELGLEASCSGDSSG